MIDDDILRALAEGCASRRLAEAWDRTGLQALRDALRALDANPVLPPHTPLLIFSGDILMVDLRDRLAQELFVFKSAEPDLTEFVMRALREGQVAYDVGAHVGYYSVVMARVVGPAGRVLAIEPTPATCALLRQSVAKFPNVDVHEAAAGDRDGDVELKDFGPTHAAFNSIKGLRHTDHAAREASAGRLRVSQITLDEMCDKTGFAPDFVKIDVESAESAVIAGMERLLSTVRPTIAVELGDFPHLQKAGVASSRGIIDLLGRHSYRPYEFKGGQLIPHKVLEEGTYTYMNVIFLPLEGGKMGWDLVCRGEPLPGGRS